MLNPHDVVTHGTTRGIAETSARFTGTAAEAPGGIVPGRPGTVAGWLDPETVSTLRQLDADEPGFLLQLIGDFLDGASARLKAMRQAQQEQDGTLLTREAHGLRGMAGTIGAERLARLAAGVEHGRSGIGLDDLESEFRHVCRALAAVLVG